MKRAESSRDAGGYSRLNRKFHAAITIAAHQATLARAVRSSLHPLVMRQFPGPQSRPPADRLVRGAPGDPQHHRHA